MDKLVKKDNYIPRLNWPTIRFLEKIITPKSMIFETGAGHSTIWFARNAQKVVSFEDRKVWHKSVLDSLRKENLTNAKIYFDLQYGEKSLDVMLDEEDRILYDIVLHDGPNNVSGRILLLKKLPAFLKPGGYFVVDDLHAPYYKSELGYLDSLKWESHIFKGNDWEEQYKEGRAYRKPMQETL